MTVLRRLKPFLRREGAVRFWGYILLACVFAELAVVVYVAAFWVPLTWAGWLWSIGASGLILFFAVCAVLGMWDDLKAERAALRGREP